MKFKRIILVFVLSMLFGIFPATTNLSAESQENIVENGENGDETDGMILVDSENGHIQTEPGAPLRQPRANLSKTITVGPTKVTATIYYDYTSGQIYSVGISGYNSSYLVYYSASSVGNGTGRKFLITTYSKNIWGGIEKALGTNEVIIYSPGPR